MPLKVAPDPNNPGGWIWVDAATGQPASQPGGPGTPFVAQSDVEPPAGAAGGAAQAPARPAGSVAYNELAQSLNKSGWTPVPGSLTKEAPRLVANPDADRPGQPPTIPQDTGRWQVVFNTPEGANRLVYLTPAGTAPGAGKDPTSDEFAWNIASAPADVPAGSSKEETNERIAAAQAQRAQAEEQRKVAEANLQKIQTDNEQIARNAAAGKGGLTDNQLADVTKAQVDQKLTADQVALRKQEIENNNRNTARSNEIAALNAATSAQNAATTARSEEARIKLGEGQLGLEEAKLEHTKAQDEIANRNAESKLKLDQLQQQQANEIAQGGLAARGAELAQKTASEAAALEQRKAEAAARAQEAQLTAQTQRQTAQLQALTNLATSGQTAQANLAQTGGQILGNRVTAATGALNNIVGQIGSSKMLNAPAGLGQAITGGLQEWITGLGGGPAVYDSAAAMVNNAHPAISQNPQIAQQAYTALRGMLDLYQAQNNGQPHPLDNPQGPSFTAPGTNANINPAAAAITGPNAQGFNPQASTAALNTAGYPDTPQGRAAAAVANPALLQTAPSPFPRFSFQAPVTY